MVNVTKCPTCGNTERVSLVEYDYFHPQHYDGASEFHCDDCGSRWGRWTGKILTGDAYELKYGGSRL